LSRREFALVIQVQGGTRVLPARTLE